MDYLTQNMMAMVILARFGNMRVDISGELTKKDIDTLCKDFGFTYDRKYYEKGSLHFKDLTIYVEVKA
jgi:hypothetical protein